MRFIEEHLEKNIEACSLFDSLTEITKKDLHNIAVDLEYEAFTSSKVVSIYRKKIAKTVEFILTLDLCLISEKMQFVMSFPASHYLCSITEVFILTT